MPDIRTIVQQMIDAGKSKEEIEEFVERAKEKMAGKTDDSPVKTESTSSETKRYRMESAKRYGVRIGRWFFGITKCN